MPYISEDRRNELDGVSYPETPGELNYVFSIYSAYYIGTKGESYQTYNDIIGALEGCKLEIYRRLISQYEDKKMKENGDVFYG
jgi:hypothetical protein